MHAWDVSPKNAIEIQQSLQSHIRITDDFGNLKTVAGVHVGFERNNTITRAAVVVLNIETLQVIESVWARHPTTFPYVPGLLSFRKVPAVLEAMLKLSTMPDLLLCDGQGIAHPRRFGVAAHLGLLLDIPTIGVGQSRPVGKHDEVPAEKGCHVPLLDDDEPIGVVLRTRANVKPLYISPGHRVSIPRSHELVMKCITRWRLPEPTRHAHKLASNL